MSNINFKTIGGPYGDATSLYEVTSTAKTVREFVDLVLKELPGEWGDFNRYEYKYGELIDKMPEAFLNREIEYPIQGHGGWTLMRYKIKLK